MTRILLVVDLPSTQHPITGEYMQNAASQILQFESMCQTIAQPTASSIRLARNVWLLDAEKNWPALVAISEAARTCRIPVQVLAIDGDVTRMTE